MYIAYYKYSEHYNNLVLSVVIVYSTFPIFNLFKPKIGALSVLYPD